MAKLVKHDFVDEYPYLVQTNAQTLVYTDKADVHYEPSVTVEGLTVTENDTYTAPEGVAYSPVTVNVSGGATEYDIHCYTTEDFETFTPTTDCICKAVFDESEHLWYQSGDVVTKSECGETLKTEDYSSLMISAVFAYPPSSDAAEFPAQGIFVMPQANVSVVVESA